KNNQTFNKIMKLRLYISSLLVILIAALIPLKSSAQQEEDTASGTVSEKKLTLARAVMCEGINGQTPQGEAVVFSVKLGRVLCFSFFDPVPQQTSISHKWFFRDKINTEVKLSLKPLRWATFSRVHLRDTDKGPWRVEIIDQEGRVLHILRFSIVD
ncbi:MAG: DUF2914 domain-containing protein, partial [Thermodesulfobacteriota bacterium]|nr:DUF2914 domain-containing protein [Thermodesulfobacteriota bacterium]